MGSIPHRKDGTPGISILITVNCLRLRLPARVHPLPRGGPDCLRESGVGINRVRQISHRGAGGHGRDEDMNHFARRGSGDVSAQVRVHGLLLLDG